jgi:murein DD-endopeptidase MepM/ murein hydrolase activator NlpD
MHVERDTAYAFAQPQQRWSGAFHKPVPSADLRSPFGKYRSYSDGKKSYHTGLDLSAERGIPVESAAAGIVLVAHEQAIFGNVVIVHHGDGVATSYNHLDEIDVKEGDQVEQGQVLGKLGATGQATGPHLHWGLEVGVVAVDPGEWLAYGFDRSPWHEEPNAEK